MPAPVDSEEEVEAQDGAVAFGGTALCKIQSRVGAVNLCGNTKRDRHCNCCASARYTHARKKNTDTHTDTDTDTYKNRHTHTLTRLSTRI